MKNILRKMLTVARSRGGFSLIEVLISLAVLAIGLLGTMNLFNAQVRGVDAGSKLTNATYIGQQKVDEFMITPYQNITAFNPVTSKGGNIKIGVYNNVFTSPSTSYSTGPFNRRWEVTFDSVTAMNSRVKTIYVYVSWTSFGKGHSVTLTTKRSED